MKLHPDDAKRIASLFNSLDVWYSAFSKAANAPAGGTNAADLRLAENAIVDARDALRDEFGIEAEPYSHFQKRAEPAPFDASEDGMPGVIFEPRAA